MLIFLKSIYYQVETDIELLNKYRDNFNEYFYQLNFNYKLKII